MYAPESYPASSSLNIFYLILQPYSDWLRSKLNYCISFVMLKYSKIYGNCQLGIDKE